MKHVLITGGPSNEYIDEVMKITNMSTGSLAVMLAQMFANNKYQVSLILTKTIKTPYVDDVAAMPNVNLVRFETTDELLRAIDAVVSIAQPDIIIHSAAVADYKPEFSFRMEDMARELAENIINELQFLRPENITESQLAKDILEVLTNPNCKVNDETKISSMEPNLTVKLGLTPKIISHLRGMCPDAYIAGFKLLENVTEGELVDAAMKQLEKCNTDIVFANDLAELRRGHTERLVVTPQGYNGIKVDGAYGIYNLIKMVTEAEDEETEETEDNEEQA